MLALTTSPSALHHRRRAGKAEGCAAREAVAAYETLTPVHVRVAGGCYVRYIPPIVSCGRPAGG